MNEDSFISLHQYVRNQRGALARRMASLNRIYLDTNYWLLVRDAYSGRPRSDTHLLLYSKLLQLVQSGKAVCPVNDDALSEVLHQSDFSTRLATANVMDQLSGGIALVGTFQRVKIEILHFLRSRRENTDSLHALSDWVWTRTCWSLGEAYPISPELPPEKQVRFQIGYYKEMAKHGIADLVTRLAGSPEPLPREFLVTLSNKLNEGKTQYAGQILSAKRAFMIEVAGVLDTFRDEIAAALAYIGKSEVAEVEEVEAEIKIITELFRTHKIGTSLPFFNTQTGLHASFRWNREQKFKPNDSIDYAHAGAALPYFDLFLTERVLASIVKSPALRYDLLYETRVCWDPTEALDALNEI